MLFLPLALLFLWRSMETGRRRDYVLAIIMISLTALSSVFGATALALSTACMLVARGRLRYARVAAALGGAAYLIVCPFLPPSLLATIRSNQQRFVEDRWTAGSLVALGLVAGGCALLVWLLGRFRAASQTRFFVLFAFVAASIPVVDAHLGLHFLPQPNRYAPELEMGAAMLLALAVAAVPAWMPRRVRRAVAVFVAVVAAEHVAGLRVFTESNTRPVDPRPGIEYRIAKWMEAHVPEGRVMVPGSIAQWFNVFTDTPQLSGASYSTTPNWRQQEAMTRVLTCARPAEVAEAVLWLKAFGVQAATVAGRRSSEFWKGNSSTKFDGLLEVLWRGEDTTVYRVPQRTTALAHVVPAGAVGDLRQYVAALEDATLPTASMRWDGLRHLTIEATVGAGQVVSVQSGDYRRWRANGGALPVWRDGLGFLVIGGCAGPCRIDLRYDGGWEYRLCRAASYLAMAGLLGFLVGIQRVTLLPNDRIGRRAD